jgi:hypothetical protein
MNFLLQVSRCTELCTDQGTQYDRPWFNNEFENMPFVYVEEIWESKVVYTSTLPETALSV